MRGYVATWDESTQTFAFYGACQSPHPLRWVLAKALRVQEAQIRVIAPHVGGSFGLKQLMEAEVSEFVGASCGESLRRRIG